MFGFKDFKHSFILILLFGIGFLAVVIPLNSLLPDYFDPMVPDFLENTSILFYVQSHFNLLVELIPVAGLLAIILVVWRSK